MKIRIFLVSHSDAFYCTENSLQISYSGLVGWLRAGEVLNAVGGGQNGVAGHVKEEAMFHHAGLLADGGGHLLRICDGGQVAIQDDIVLISEGIQDGDIVLTRRPPSPLEGMALEVSFEGDAVEIPVSESVADFENIEEQEVGS